MLGKWSTLLSSLQMSPSQLGLKARCLTFLSGFLSDLPHEVFYVEKFPSPCFFSPSHPVSSYDMKIPAPYVCLLFHVLQMSRSASTFSLSDSAKSSAVVQRSNSLDHPPVRPRVPVCLRTLCSPAPTPGHDTAPEISQHLCPNYCPSSQESKSILHAPVSAKAAPPRSSLHTSQQTSLSDHPTSTALPPVRNSKSSQPKSSQPVSRHPPPPGFQQRSLAPQPVNVKGRTFSESCRDPQVPLDPRKAVLSSPRRETLL